MKHIKVFSRLFYPEPQNRIGEKILVAPPHLETIQESVQIFPFPPSPTHSGKIIALFMSIPLENIYVIDLSTLLWQHKKIPMKLSWVEVKRLPKTTTVFKFEISIGKKRCLFVDKQSGYLSFVFHLNRLVIFTVKLV